MGFKRFGKLAGKTNARAALINTAASNTYAPYVAQDAGAKCIAYGEGASSETMNRLAVALQENIECLAGTLDTPALADTRIMPADSASYGSGALTDVAAGTTNIDLTVSAGGPLPITWVYTGLHKSRIGDFIRLYRQSAATQAGQQEYESLNPLTAEHNNVVIPTDIRPTWAGTSIFTDPVTGNPAAYLENVGGFTSPHSLAIYIPPIIPTICDISPYGAVIVDNVGTWFNDGITTDGTYSWRDLYVRPGCFVHITDGGVNNGLYRIAHLTHNHTTSNDKAVLTRGGLHKVAVANAAVFTPGRLVCWSSYPQHANPGLTLNDKENFAYCVFADTATNHIYLAEIGGEEDFPTFGLGNTNGQKVDSVSGTYGTASAVGEVGIIDYETDAGDSIALRVGTLIYDAADLAVVQAVVSVVPANYPVSFDTTVAGAKYTPCNPLGFYLNPMLSVTGAEIIGGSYTMHCKTLTTVREKLASYGANGRQKLVMDPSDKLDYSAFEAGQIRAFARYLKTGSESAATRGNASEYPSGPFVATSMLLGDSLWQVTFTPSGPDLDTVATIGAAVFLMSPDGQATVAQIQAVTGNVATIYGVNTAAWNMTSRGPAYAGDKQLPIQVNSVLTIGGDTFTVASVEHGPYLYSYSGVKYVPSFGLDAAYNHQYAATRNARVEGAGNYIRLAPNRPITAILPTAGLFTANNVAFQINSTNDLNQVLLQLTGAASNASIRMNGTSLAFRDTFTPADVPLSSLAYATLPGVTTSILEALQRGLWEFSSGTVRPSSVSGVTGSSILAFPVVTPDWVAGTERKLIVDVDNNALRMGTVVDTSWDAANRGDHSVAFGHKTAAAYQFSTAIGNGAVAERPGGTAIAGAIVSSGGVEQPGYAQYGTWHCIALLPAAGTITELLSVDGSVFLLDTDSTYFIEGTIVGRAASGVLNSIAGKFMLQISTKLDQLVVENRACGTGTILAEAAVPGDTHTHFVYDTATHLAWANTGNTEDGGGAPASGAYVDTARIQLTWDLVTVVGSGYLRLRVSGSAALAGDYRFSCSLKYDKARFIAA